VGECTSNCGGESKHNLAFLLMDLAKSPANIWAVELNSLCEEQTQHILSLEINIIHYRGQKSQSSLLFEENNFS
jgi:hypothetical protein